MWNKKSVFSLENVTFKVSKVVSLLFLKYESSSCNFFRFSLKKVFSLMYFREASFCWLFIEWRRWIVSWIVSCSISLFLRIIDFFESMSRERCSS